MSDTNGLVGQTIASQFRVLKKLGAGGMGSVYLAEQEGMDRKVVVKVMHPELTAGSPKAAERFKREAKAVAQLNHPNIVQIYVFGATDVGQMYIAMEFIEGRDLTADLKRGAMAQPKALRILDQICAALTEAHGAGVVHRDLKPDNIMLADRHGNPDYVKVLDFGIAKMTDGGGQGTLTETGAVFGTPRYMSPEQAKGETIDTRTDIYALGVVFYEMLTAKHPFDATTALDYIVKHATEEPVLPSIKHADLGIQPRVEAILARCMQKDKAARYQSARELQRAAREALRDFPEAQRGFPTHEPPAHRTAATIIRPDKPDGSKRNLAWLWPVAILVLLGGGALAGVMLSQKDTASTQGETPGTAAGVTAGGDSGATKGADGPKGPSASTGDGAAAEKPPDTEKTPPPAGDPDLAEGMPIRGFPVPARARLQTSTGGGELLETDLSATQVLAFYKAKLAGKYGALSDVPNGIAVAGTETPYNVVTVRPGGAGLHIFLQRNALAADAGKPTAEGKVYFGVPGYPGATETVKTSYAATLTSRDGMAKVCDFYLTKYRDTPKLMTTRMLDASTPMCSVIAQPGADVPFMTISAVEDKSSPGNVIINIQPKM